MKSYHSVAMYNQAVQVLELPRSPHHPLLATLVYNFTQTTIFFKQLLCEIITGSLLVAKQAHFNAHITVHNI